MITLMFMQMVKVIFYLVLDLFKALLPTMFAGMTSSLISIMSYQGVSFGLFLFNLLVPMEFFSGVFTLTITFIVVSKLVYAITNRVGTPPFGSGTS